MKKVIVFDLDDTLYDEMSFVRSGFRAVSRTLETRYGISGHEAYEYMVEVLNASGRGKVFDEMLIRFGLRASKYVKECLQTYRQHLPEIRLHEDAARCLNRLAAHPIYIVTDGNKLVQQSKISALGLDNDTRIKKCFITRRYGIHREKPSTYCFLRIAELEQVAAQNITYIGDNPRKDFVGIKPQGFRTIRVIRGSHAGVRLTPDFEADVEIMSLDELHGGLL